MNTGQNAGARASSPARNRSGIAVRAVTALVAGYALASASTALLSAVLPFARIERVFTATLLAFAVWGCAALYAFAAPTAWRGLWRTAALALLLYLPVLLWPSLAVRP